MRALRYIQAFLLRLAARSKGLKIPLLKDYYDGGEVNDS